MELSEASEELVAQLRILGNNYGPLGVALVASKLTDVGVLVQLLLSTEDRDDQPVEARSLASDIQHAINFHSAENGSNTPDFILAEYLLGCLAAFDKAVQMRVHHGSA
jgi:hypothetical protein